MYWLSRYFRDVIRLPLHENVGEAKVLGSTYEYGVNFCENVDEVNRSAVFELNSGGDIRPAPTYLRAKKDL